MGSIDNPLGLQILQDPCRHCMREPWDHTSTGRCLFDPKTKYERIQIMTEPVGPVFALGNKTQGFMVMAHNKETEPPPKKKDSWIRRTWQRLTRSS